VKFVHAALQQFRRPLVSRNDRDHPTSQTYIRPGISRFQPG
jgi:hypothetical protein